MREPVYQTREQLNEAAMRLARTIQRRQSRGLRSDAEVRQWAEALKRALRHA